MYVIYLLLGFVIGCINYGGLILTIKKLKTKKAACVIYLSFVARTAFVLGSFFLLMKNDWKILGSLLLGFILSRIILISLVKRKKLII